MNKNQKAIADFDKHCEQVVQFTTIKANESPKDIEARIARARKDYAFFVDYYFPHYAKSKCGDFHIKAANKVKKEPNLKAVMEWARGHAKSTHFDIMIPLWLKIQTKKEINVMVLVGKSEDNADTLLSDIQAELQYNRRYIKDFGEQYQSGSWEIGEFVTKDGTAFFARGRGQSPRGLRHRDSRPDYIVIDDFDDDELVQNESRVKKMTDWILEALLGAMDMGRGRFIMVGNRIHKNSVLANMAKRPGMFHMVVNALDNEDNPTWHQKYKKEEIYEIRNLMGYRRFQKEYMNNPIQEGAVFNANWINWKPAYSWNKYDHIIAYCDPSFKSSFKNDYKAIKVWGKKGTELHLIKCFVRQCSVSTMVKWFYDLHESIPSDVICEYMMEANFVQDLILEEFTLEGNIRGYQLPIRGDYRQKPDKFQRIEALSPLYERGFIFYNEKIKDSPDMITALDQLLAFEKGSRVPDDSPDADEGAIFYLQQKTRIADFNPTISKRKTIKIY